MSSGHDEGTGVEKGASLPPRPETDKLARDVRRARIENKLFATEERVRVGRYQLLEMVGSGGIGVVWGAWDPELERRVAIKLIKPAIAAARDRILLEGQALAKLSHPNVVPIYDVGVFGEQVYLVMEWVRGSNLRVYCAEPRKIRDILAIYRAAGEGLFAAHRAGMIHRDFKPDNAIRGDDERVRVLDFGLARGEDDTRAASGAGTPRYMAPEQAEHETITPAADQYAFCVSLREALVERDGPDTHAVVPGWLDTILTKGTNREPGRRHAAMGELLRALARDPATIWRRRLLVGAAVVVAGGAFAVGSLRSQYEVEPCIGGAAEIRKTWNPEARDKMVAHLASLGAYGAEAATPLSDAMAAYAERWAATHQNTCLASERHELTSQLYEKNLACLARASVGYETVVEVLSSAPAARLDSAIVAARGLPDVDQCAFESTASTVTPPPRAIAPLAVELAAEIERARVLARTDDPNALALTKAAVDRADTLAFDPLIARAHLAHGLALVAAEQNTEAIVHLERAALAAVDAFDDLTLVEAQAREIFAARIDPKQDAGPTTRYIEHVAKRSGAAGVFARALLYNNLGTARLTAGDAPGARGWFDKSIAERAPADAELLMAFANRALVTETAAERDELLGHARAKLTELLGANHTKTLIVRLLASVFIANPQRVAGELRDVCALYQRYHPTVSADTIECLFELGWLAEERGDLTEAQAAMQQIPSGNGSLPQLAKAYLAMLDGKLEVAAAAALVVGENFQAEPWTRFDAAEGLLLAAICLDKLQRRDAAVASARAALKIFEQLTSNERYRRRLARTRAVLARLGVPEAKQLARDAVGWYRAAGGYDSIVNELDAITAGSR